MEKKAEGPAGREKKLPGKQNPQPKRQPEEKTPASGISPQVEPVLKSGGIRVLSGPFVQIVRGLELHDIKNRLYTITNTCITVGESLDLLAQDGALSARITDFGTGRDGFEANAKRMAELDRDSANAFKVIAAGNPDLDMLRGELKGLAQKGTGVLACFEQALAEAMAELFIEDCREQMARGQPLDGLQQAILNAGNAPGAEAHASAQAIRDCILQKLEAFPNEPDGGSRHGRLREIWNGVRGGHAEIRQLLKEDWFFTGIQGAADDIGNSDLAGHARISIQDIRKVPEAWNRMPRAGEDLAELQEIERAVERAADLGNILRNFMKGRDPAKVIRENSREALRLARLQVDFLQKAMDALAGPDGALAGELLEASDVEEVGNQMLNAQANLLDCSEHVRRSLQTLESMAVQDGYALRLEKSDVRKAALEAARKALNKEPRVERIVWEEGMDELGKRVRAFGCETDAFLLREALFTVISNAMKYAESQVSVGAESRGGEVAIWVRDDGPGMSLADAGQAFVRGGHSSDPRERSTHYGLWAAQEMGKACGWTISITDCGPAGGGVQTTFELVIQKKGPAA